MHRANKKINAIDKQRCFLFCWKLSWPVPWNKAPKSEENSKFWGRSRIHWLEISQLTGRFANFAYVLILERKGILCGPPNFLVCRKPGWQHLIRSPPWQWKQGSRLTLSTMSWQKPKWTITTAAFEKSSFSCNSCNSQTESKWLSGSRRGSWVCALQESGFAKPRLRKIQFPGQLLA